jgi:hypothetical protein
LPNTQLETKCKNKSFKSNVATLLGGGGGHRLNSTAEESAGMSLLTGLVPGPVRTVSTVRYNAIYYGEVAVLPVVTSCSLTVGYQSV